MIRGITLLLACQLVGEVAARGLVLPVPGPVLGLLLLLVVLIVAERVGRVTRENLAETEIGRVSDGLLTNLAVLFVPAGVGVVQYLGLVGRHGLGLGLALVGSALVTLLVTVGAFLLVKRLAGDLDEGPPP